MRARAPRLDARVRSPARAPRPVAPKAHELARSTAHARTGGDDALAAEARARHDAAARRRASGRRRWRRTGGDRTEVHGESDLARIFEGGREHARRAAARRQLAARELAELRAAAAADGADGTSRGARRVARGEVVDAPGAPARGAAARGDRQRRARAVPRRARAVPGSAPNGREGVRLLAALLGAAALDADAQRRLNLSRGRAARAARQRRRHSGDRRCLLGLGLVLDERRRPRVLEKAAPPPPSADLSIAECRRSEHPLLPPGDNVRARSAADALPRSRSHVLFKYQESAGFGARARVHPAPQRAALATRRCACAAAAGRRRSGCRRTRGIVAAPVQEASRPPPRRVTTGGAKPSDRPEHGAVAQ